MPPADCPALPAAQAEAQPATGRPRLAAHTISTNKTMSDISTDVRYGAANGGPYQDPSLRDTLTQERQAVATQAGRQAGRQCVVNKQAGRLRRQAKRDLGAASEGQVGEAGEGVQHSHALVAHPGAAQQSQAFYDVIAAVTGTAWRDEEVNGRSSAASRSDDSAASEAAAVSAGAELVTEVSDLPGRAGVCEDAASSEKDNCSNCLLQSPAAGVLGGLGLLCEAVRQLLCLL
ncbi:MAG: hypothetical protein FRX49_09969 [Trebouxia sp. A1-2]|nr:MAG: hypothetical protein FRX49_09969 [Trebouxia sp. A1-2]